MPYKAAGQVKNATIEAVVNLDFTKTGADITVYATSVEEVLVELTRNGRVIFADTASLSPTQVYRQSVKLSDSADKTCFLLTVRSGDRVLVSYRPEPEVIPKMPKPAKAAKQPCEIQTNEELYLTALHIEQYRHATFLPDPYYLEGLKRDPYDTRINDAYGMLLLRRGLFAEAEMCFRKSTRSSDRA